MLKLPNVLHDARRRSCVMQALFVLQFHHRNKKNKIDRLITCHGFKNGRKDEQCSQTGDVIFSSLIPLAVYTLFGSVVKKPFGSCMYPEYPVLDKRYKDYKEFSFDMVMNHYWINIPFSD